MAVEKQGFGFLNTAQANQQVSALVIRGISELIYNETRTDREAYQEIASHHASVFAFELLAKLKLQSYPQPALLKSPTENRMVQHNIGNASGAQANVTGGNAYFGNVYYGTFPKNQSPALASTSHAHEVKESYSFLSEEKIFDLPQTIPVIENFRERLGLVKKIESILIRHQDNNKHRVVYLTGKPGIGKSTLAYHFADLYKENSSHFKDGIIGLRIDANKDLKRENIFNRFISILKKYDSTIVQDDERDAKEIIQSFFQNKNFLIIIDNATEKTAHIFAILFSDLYRDQHQCSVIVTTQIKDYYKYVEKLTKIGGNTVEIPKFASEESLELLQGFIGRRELESLEKSLLEANNTIC